MWSSLSGWHRGEMQAAGVGWWAEAVEPSLLAHAGGKTALDLACAPHPDRPDDRRL
jgi:hypothetical protein